jgi:hypothetical protein
MRLPELNSYHCAIKSLVLQHKTAMLFQRCTDNAAGQGILNCNLSLAQFVLVICVVDDNSSSLGEKKRLTQRQEIISVSSQVHQL